MDRETIQKIIDRVKNGPPPPKPDGVSKAEQFFSDHPGELEVQNQENSAIARLFESLLHVISTIGNTRTIRTPTGYFEETVDEKGRRLTRIERPQTDDHRHPPIHIPDETTEN